jgi:hypothetical protein
MVKNFEICPHCQTKGLQGQMRRPGVAPPVINRSNGSSFHLVLIDFPAPAPAPSGGPASNRSFAEFKYVVDASSDAVHTCRVILTRRGMDREGSVAQLERIADDLAVLLDGNSKPAKQYQFDGTTMPECDPSQISARDGVR